MEDTNVKLSIDASSKVLSQLGKHRAAITIDIGPNLILAIKYLATSWIIYKSIDVIANVFGTDKKRSSSSSKHAKEEKR